MTKKQWIKFVLPLIAASIFLTISLRVLGVDPAMRILLNVLMGGVYGWFAPHWI